MGVISRAFAWLFFTWMYHRDLARVPWHSEDPAPHLITLFRSGQLAPGRCLDAGCGAGANAVYLAAKGFKVTGVDFSHKALQLARERARRHNVSCHFIQADVLSFMVEVPFDIVLDWGCFHGFRGKERQRYVSQVSQWVRVGGHYLLSCFAKREVSLLHLMPPFPLGEDLIRQLFEPHFAVLQKQSETFPGNFYTGMFQVDTYLMQRRARRRADGKGAASFWQCV
jgi:cyclopropane fatty-acyl-phospholipid synthase-like methyltransferase